jgi:hypothetical protein
MPSQVRDQFLAVLAAFWWFFPSLPRTLVGSDPLDGWAGGSEEIMLDLGVRQALRASKL